MQTRDAALTWPAARRHRATQFLDRRADLAPHLEVRPVRGILAAIVLVAECLPRGSY